jgi:AraC-like DNA-binding protein
MHPGEWITSWKDVLEFPVELIVKLAVPICRGRRAFVRFVGITPAEYRKRFS